MSFPSMNPPEGPEYPDDSMVLDTLADILKNGGKIPSDPVLVQRLTLAAVREVWRSSSRNQNQLSRQWKAVIILFAAITASAAFTTITHANIWDAIHALQAIIGGVK